MAHLVLPNGKGHGWKPDTPDYRDKLMRGARPRIAVTGPVALKSEYLPAVRDQGQLGSCTGHGVTGGLMYKLRERGRAVELSALYAYYQGRVLEASVDEDAGAEIRDVVKAAAKQGVSTLACWPYRIERFAKKPTKTADRTAQSHQVKVGYYRCLTVDDIVQALAQGMPVVGGFSCFSNLDANGNGHIPMPAGVLEGGHCVWFVGADPHTRELKFQNSWAADWGEHGYGYLPFDYLAKGLADDFWAIDHE